MNNTPKPLRLGAWLAAAHTVLFLPFFMLVPADGDSWFMLTPFSFLDYPVRDLYAAPSFLSPLWTIPVAGGLFWFCVGGVILALRLRRAPGGRERVAVSALSLTCVCLLPGLAWGSLREWERHWHRGLTAGEDFRPADAIPHLEEAIRWSPPDNEWLGALWAYLGDMHLRLGETAAAETAHTRRLEWETGRPAPDPECLISIWNDLAGCAERRGDSARRRECLRNAIAQCRIAHGVDSDPEARCLSALARTAWKSGDLAEARELMERAVHIWETLSDPDGADWGRDTLADWSAR